MESMTQIDWGLIFRLIDPALMLVVAACWVIGFALKRTPLVYRIGRLSLS